MEGERRGVKADYLLAVIRIFLGLIFLWAFFDKLIGLGFSTCLNSETGGFEIMCDKAWMNGGSPTTGFLSFGVKGPFAGIFQSMAGSVLVDWSFMLGLLGIGLTLTFGFAIRFGSICGALMLSLMWLAVLPPGHHPVLDEHIIYMLILIYFVLAPPRKLSLHRENNAVYNKKESRNNNGKPNKKSGLSTVLNVFLIIGMLVSLFLLYEHFSPSASKYCTFGESFDCGIVNKSPYANLDGIFYLLTIDYGLPLPLIDISGINVFFDFITANAFLGFLALLFVFLLNTRYKNKKFLWITPEKNLKWKRGILVFGLLYGIYLIYIQHFILKTYCIFCLVLDAVMLGSVIAVYRMKK